MLENFFEHEIFFNEYITGNKFIESSNGNDILFCKTDYLPQFFNKTCRNLITHNSDYHINEQRFLSSPNCEKWFCQNKDHDSEKLVGIPIGLENMYPVINQLSQNGLFSSKPNNAMEKAVFLSSLAEKKIEHDDLIYMNFSIKTNVKERKPVWESFRTKDWVTTKSELSWQEYYWDLATHKFAISPNGNGVDCHRIWECLYLRTVPIVLESIHVREFLDLPILVVKNWNEISYNFLHEQYERINQTKFDLSKMKMSYWEQAVNEK